MGARECAYKLSGVVSLGWEGARFSESAGLPTEARSRVRRAKVGGEAGIRTLDTAFGPYNGLANRRLQPLGHLTAEPQVYVKSGSRSTF